MQIYQTVEALREARRNANKVAFVPTMGNLHEGHISLMQQAKAHAETVIASIFVNRLQFGPNEDFDKYPRTFADDCARLEAAGVDILFAPTEVDLYPEPQEYTVEPPTIQHQLDGEFRPGHFRGVATVVLKLFNIVQPDVALFGKKDYQQLMVIRNMTRQLALPITIIGGDTIRADDGLALSSRNGYLTPDERQEAIRLSRLLREIKTSIQAGNRQFAELEAKASAELNASGWVTDYIAIRRQSDLQMPSGNATVQVTEPLVVLAASKLGKTRLIDNLEI
jgi:pantoate--beta-alanine ligase